MNFFNFKMYLDTIGTSVLTPSFKNISLQLCSSMTFKNYLCTVTVTVHRKINILNIKIVMSVPYLKMIVFVPTNEKPIKLIL